MTYDELKTKIRDYTEVNSTVFTDTILNGFIEDAEFRLLRDVDSDNNRFYATALLTVNQRYVQNPADLLIVRSAQIVDSSGVGAGTERDFLDYRDTNFMAESVPNSLLNILPRTERYRLIKSRRARESFERMITEDIQTQYDKNTERLKQKYEVGLQTNNE